MAGEDFADDEEKFGAMTLVRLYPTKKRKANQAASVFAARDAVRRDGWDRVLAGTERFAENFACWKAGTSNFASDPVDFFGQGEYLDPDSKNQNIDPEKQRQRAAELAKANRDLQDQEDARRAASERAAAEAIRQRAAEFSEHWEELVAEFGLAANREEVNAIWYTFSETLSEAGADQEVIDHLSAEAGALRHKIFKQLEG